MDKNKRKMRRKRRASMIKKSRPSEETEQEKDVVMLDHSQPMETFMQAATDQQQKMFMVIHSRSMEKVLQVTGLLMEILSRLPVKSLLRFLCVCRNWKTLISSHYFRKLHRQKHSSTPPLLVASYNYPRSDIEQSDILTYLITFDFFKGNLVEKVTVPIPLEKFHMATPPYQAKLLFFFNSHLMKFYLYNPSTRQSFLLTNPSFFSSPKININYNSDYGYPRRSSRLANPFRHKKHYSTDYGYIPSKDEYIMVHLVRLSYGKLYCEVLNNISISNDNFKLHYSSQWRSSSEATIIIRSVVGQGVFVCGAFYWQANDQNSEVILLSFDVETECFSTLGYPQDLSGFCDTSLLQLNDELYLVYYPRSVLVMWKLSIDNKLWTRYWEFDFERLFGFTRGIKCDMRYFRWEIFIYNLKYIKGYDHQPCDHEVSFEMGKLLLENEQDEMPFWNVAAHTNLFTL